MLNKNHPLAVQRVIFLSYLSGWICEVSGRCRLNWVKLLFPKQFLGQHRHRIFKIALQRLQESCSNSAIHHSVIAA